MRAQFNQTGGSTYHLRSARERAAGCTINVPANQGTLLQSGRGVDLRRRQHQLVGGADQEPRDRRPIPTHLPIYLTNNVLLHIGQGPVQLLRHRLPRYARDGARRRQRQQQRQRRRCRPSPGPRGSSRASTPSRTAATNWALQDIHALSHEIAEWADDPFVNNTVEPWLTPTAPQYGCTGILETGDPVVDIGFAMGTNTFQQGPNPNGSTERRRVLPPGGRGVAAVVHAHGAEHGSEPTQIAIDQHRSLHADGRPQPVPGLPRSRPPAAEPGKPN